MKKPRKVRTDTGAKRVNYKIKHDNTGKVGKENAALKSFWSTHTVEEMMSISGEDLEKVINEWIADFQQRQLKRDPSWWYPNLGELTISQARYNKKPINVSFNSSFVKKKML